MGGGGDGGYAARQEEQERQKQQARNALNVNFGVAPGPSSIRREDFMTPGFSGASDSGQIDSPGTFDQAGYDAAVAAAAAQAADAERNKGSLDALYQGARDNAFTAGARRLDDDYSRNSRDLRFELLARGLGGGSVDADQNATLSRIYGEGRTDLGARADATATGLRTSDEATRLGLLQSIDAGMDQGSAVSSALAQMKNNSDRATAEAQGVTLGNIFDSAGLLYSRDRRAQGERRAASDWSIFGQSRPSRARGSPQGLATNAYDG
jgi:hypothetical protein